MNQDLSGNQIGLTRTTGIYRCHYGLRGQQYCENYRSKAPVVEPGDTQTVTLQGEADDRNEAPITDARFDLNGRFLIFDPTKRLSIVTANFPGIPNSSQ